MSLIFSSSFFLPSAVYRTTEHLVSCNHQMLERGRLAKGRVPSIYAFRRSHVNEWMGYRECGKEHVVVAPAHRRGTSAASELNNNCHLISVQSSENVCRVTKGVYILSWVACGEPLKRFPPYKHVHSQSDDNHGYKAIRLNWDLCLMRFSSSWESDSEMTG